MEFSHGAEPEEINFYNRKARTMTVKIAHRILPVWFYIYRIIREEELYWCEDTDEEVQLHWCYQTGGGLLLLDQLGVQIALDNNICKYVDRQSVRVMRDHITDKLEGTYAWQYEVPRSDYYKALLERHPAIRAKVQSGEYVI